MPVFLIRVHAIGVNADSATQHMLVRAVRKEQAVAAVVSRVLNVGVATEEELVSAGANGYGDIIDAGERIAVAGS